MEQNQPQTKAKIAINNHLSQLWRMNNFSILYKLTRKIALNKYRGKMPIVHRADKKGSACQLKNDNGSIKLYMA